MSSALPLHPLPASVSIAAGDAQAGAASTARADMAFRPDIEGLRGIAVLSVLAVHAFPNWAPGGFVGVDIFFVLSGFLISGILLRSFDAAQFSVMDFYVRRARRILPALCLVLLACLLFSVWFTVPAESRRVGQHVLGGSLFISNFFLWKEAGYFDVASEAKPLLHLWSLGIEEQFYIVWPWVVAMRVRHRRHAVAALCLGLVLSFALNLALVADRPTATFFLPPTRAWELMLGALLALLSHDLPGGPIGWLQRRFDGWPVWQRALPDLVSAGGALLIVAALLLIDHTDHFPGAWALLPTLGTVALLAAGPEASINRTLLALPALRFYGNISYPLYLWHWPLLSFPVVLGLPLDNAMRVGILVASVVLGAATTVFLEKPLRHGTGWRVPAGLCAALLLIGAAGFGVRASDGLLTTYPAKVRDIASAEFAFDYAEYRVDRCMLRLADGPDRFADECVDRRAPERELVLLWGDSHAASLYPGLAHWVGANDPAQRLGQYTAARCPPLLVVPAMGSPHCAETVAYVLDRIVAERPGTVVLAGYWTLYGSSPAALDAHFADLRRTVERLQSMGVRKVVVFGHLPTWSVAQPRLLLEAWRRHDVILERSHDGLDPLSLGTDAALARALAGSGALIVSPQEQMCDAQGCLASIAHDGVYSPIAYDASHLSAEGSVDLIRRTREVLAP